MTVGSHSWRVLIIDSNMMDVLEMETVLVEAGYEVSKLLSANGALAKIEFEHPDILLVDITMPQLNAAELVDEIRKNPELDSMALLVFSGLDPNDLEEFCEVHQMNGYFSKSMKYGEILLFLDELFREDPEL